MLWLSESCINAAKGGLRWKKLHKAVVFIVVPKNSGLKEYRQKALDILDIKDIKTLEVRGEDVPFWVESLTNNGKRTIGLTGEDLYQEYQLKTNQDFKIINRIEWYDESAMFRKPTLCLLGPKGKQLESIPKNATIFICAKYKAIAEKYLDSINCNGFNKVYVNGCVELSYSEGVSDIVIDIVYSGKSMNKYGLGVYDKILQSDFLIIAKGDIDEWKI